MAFMVSASYAYFNVISSERSASAPSNICMRRRINPADRSTSRRQAASRVRTWSTASRSSIVVARSTAAPTVMRQANATFSDVSGAFRRTAASASGMTSATGITPGGYH